MTTELERIVFGVVRNQTNFIWVETNRCAMEVFDDLAAHGVLVRKFATLGSRLARRLRVTIGSQTANNRFLEIIARFV
jgi:histidinol-phosphate/aromatic aminotransferase/cobyric acid decarboxylase-like protein